MSSCAGVPTAFRNFRVVPPGTGICHQVNLEYLAQVVWADDVDGKTVAYPDTLVGTDSHTTMVNGLAVLGWGVGGIEAEAAMLGQPVSMLIPEVVGFKLTGKLQGRLDRDRPRAAVVEMLRAKGVVGKFVEFLRRRPGRADPGRPRNHRQHGPGISVPPAASSRSTARPSVSEVHRPLTKTHCASSRLMPKRKACGASKAARTRSSPIRWNSTWAPLCRACRSEASAGPCSAVRCS